MNVSHHTYAAPKPKNYVGIGFVVAVHLAAIYALSAGLMKQPVKAIEPIIMKPLPPDVIEQPKPPEAVRVDKPTFKEVPLIQVPAPDIKIEQPMDTPLVGTYVAPKDPVVTDRPVAREVVVPQQPVKNTGIQSPGAVCSVMPKPEVPALNWTGEAVLHVVATVRGGRVVGTEFSLLQGALDAKSKRALQRSAESALAGYQCLGDASFQQDFAFRLE